MTLMIFIRPYLGRTVDAIVTWKRYNNSVNQKCAMSGRHNYDGFPKKYFIMYLIVNDTRRKSVSIHLKYEKILLFAGCSI